MDPQKKIYVDEIRKVHKELRRKYRKGQNFTEVWKQHCQDEEALDKYAKSMQDLATEIWDEDCDGTHRIQWCVDTCKHYFQAGELEKLLEKDKRREAHYQEDQKEFHCGPNPRDDFLKATDVSQRCLPDKDSKLQLLDVGSCYDPFRRYNEFETTAIDLKPACKNVFKCDFLKVESSPDPGVAQNHLSHPQAEANHHVTSREIHILPTCFFDIVVFSLLLTYIPSPHARWEMCQKAHRVLKIDGLLLIITPDSSHQNKNAALMKKWKSAIERIGFQRIKYSKDRHLHFMTFRKVPNNFLWDRRKIGTENTEYQYESLNIPQDFQESSEESEDDDDQNDTNDFIMQNFSELPQFMD